MIGALRVKVAGAYVPAGVIGGSGQQPTIFCTYATRPGSPTQGQEIFETDTKNKLVYDGTGWQYLGTPPGVIEQFAGPTLPPGYAACDSSALSRITYASLYAAIGTTWGVGDGSTTFNVPDGRDRALIGEGNSHAQGSTEGLAYGAARDARWIHSHSHTQNDHSHSMSFNSQAASADHTHPVQGENTATNVVVTQSGATPVVGNSAFQGHRHLNNTTGMSVSHIHLISGSTGGQSDGTVSTTDTGVHPYLSVKFMIKL